MNLNQYQEAAFKSSRIDWETPRGRQVAILGVLGELGSLATVIKKRIRDGQAYTTFLEDLAEESGDVLWYVAAIATHYELKLENAIAAGQRRGPIVGQNAHLWSLIDSVMLLNSILAADDEYFAVDPENLEGPLGETAAKVLDAMSVEGLVLSDVLSANLEKTSALFLDVDGPAPHRDFELPIYEQLPRQALVQFIERLRGAVPEVLLRINGLTMGDRLTDNSADPDGYRYHDVLHLGYLAVLGWSPVTRALLRLKRKSKKEIDENQDGARAIIIEEAITQQIFSHAREYSLYRGVERLDYGTLKWVTRMVRGLEVERCTAAEWQRAILQGYAAFRSLNEHRGGYLIVDAEKRELRFSVDEPVASRSPDL